MRHLLFTHACSLMTPCPFNFPPFFCSLFSAFWKFYSKLEFLTKFFCWSRSSIRSEPLSAYFFILSWFSRILCSLAPLVEILFVCLRIHYRSNRKNRPVLFDVFEKFLINFLIYLGKWPNVSFHSVTELFSHKI